MKGKYLPKVLRPSTRSRTEQDEDEQPRSFHVLTPDELRDANLAKQLPKTTKENLAQEIKRKKTLPLTGGQKAIELPKIDHLSGSQAKTDTP